MTFDELVAEVILIVKRPDMRARIESAIRAATLKVHRSDFYYRDIVESGVQIAQPDYIVNFDPNQVFPSFRKISYIRHWNYDPSDSTAYGRPGRMYDFIDTNSVFDGYGYQKANVAYMAGQLIQLRSTVEVSHLLVGAYVNPIVTPEASYSSWIANDYPFAIIYEAARSIFMGAGNLEDANGQERLLAEEYRVLKVNSIGMPGE